MQKPKEQNWAPVQAGPDPHKHSPLLPQLSVQKPSFPQLLPKGGSHTIFFVFFFKSLSWLLSTCSITSEKLSAVLDAYNTKERTPRISWEITNGGNNYDQTGSCLPLSWAELGTEMLARAKLAKRTFTFSFILRSAREKFFSRRNIVSQLIHKQPAYFSSQKLGSSRGRRGAVWAGDRVDIVSTRQKSMRRKQWDCRMTSNWDHHEREDFRMTIGLSWMISRYGGLRRWAHIISRGEPVYVDGYCPPTTLSRAYKNKW